MSSLVELSFVWKEVLADLGRELDPQLFQAYVKPLRFKELDSSNFEVHVAAPSALVARHVGDKYKDKILLSLGRYLNLSEELKLKISVELESKTSSGNLDSAPSSSGPNRNVVVKKISGQASSARPTSNSSVLGSVNPKYTFSNFVVGNSNQFCHAAAIQVAERPGESYNPLFIYGGVGLGKTHLLHAIGNAVLTRNPKARVLYMSSEAFTNELIKGLKQAKMEEFKNRLRNIEVLLIDDIQFICGKERTQEEFFHTFNSLYNSKHQIVLTSDKIAQDISGIEERLRTRFSWGLTADLQAPDFETRVAILKKRAALDGLTLPEEVAHFVANKISSNVRELEGALTRLHAESALKGRALTIESAEIALRPILQPRQVNITTNDIKRCVADRFGIKISDMISKRRTKNLSFPRHVAMYLCRKHTTLSYPEIGCHFGNRDHSSVIHASQVVSSKISKDPEIKRLVAEIEKGLFNTH